MRIMKYLKRLRFMHAKYKYGIGGDRFYSYFGLCVHGQKNLYKKKPRIASPTCHQFHNTCLFVHRSMNIYIQF